MGNHTTLKTSQRGLQPPQPSPWISLCWKGRKPSLKLQNVHTSLELVDQGFPETITKILAVF